MPKPAGYTLACADSMVVGNACRYNSYRLYEETNGDLRIPSWVRALLYGTFAIFSSFSFVLPLYQRLPPGFYFGAEISYCILSLTAKLFLGTILIVRPPSTHQAAYTHPRTFNHYTLVHVCAGERFDDGGACGGHTGRGGAGERAVNSSCVVAVCRVGSLCAVCKLKCPSVVNRLSSVSHF